MCLRLRRPFGNVFVLLKRCGCDHYLSLELLLSSFLVVFFGGGGVEFGTAHRSGSLVPLSP